MSLRHSHLAKSGCTFNADDSVHQQQDATRWAQSMQSARDRGNYAEADHVKAIALACGAIVRMGKDWTYVFDGDPAQLPHPQWPDYSGYAEWVDPSKVNGRHVLEICYKHQPGKYFFDLLVSNPIHSVRVANWRDHPNLQAARGAGWPDTLWTHAGQAGMEAATDCWWTLDQMKKLEKAARDMAIKADIAGWLP